MIKIARQSTMFLLLATVLLFLPYAQSRLFYLPLPNLHPSPRQDHHHQLLSSEKNIPSSPPPPPPPVAVPPTPPLHKRNVNLRKATELDMGQDGKDISSSDSDEQTRTKTRRIEQAKKRDLIDWPSLLKQRTAGARSPYIQPNDDEDDNLLPDSLNQWDENDQNTYLHRVSRKPVTVAPSLTTKASPLESGAAHDDNEPWLNDNKTARYERLLSNGGTGQVKRRKRNDTIFLAIVAVCSLIGIIGLLGAAIFWYKIQKRAEAAAEAEYPSYGVTGPQTKISPSSSSMSDRKLAQSAQMYHYQQQRQAMMQQEKAHMDAKPVQSDESDDEGTGPGGGDYTVYECPGLAPTGEMEVRNPLFTEPDTSLNSPSPSTAQPSTNNHYPQLSSSASPPKEKSLQ